MKPTIALHRFLLTSSLLAAVSIAHAADGTWIQTEAGPFDWGTLGNWNGTIADGAGSTAFFTPDITADQTVNLEAARSIGNITFTDSTTSTNNLIISGANILTLAGTTPSVNVTQAGRTLTISSEIAGSDGLRKIGPGALTLNGSSVNTFTGGLAVNLGTLGLDFTNLATPTNLIDSGNALSLGGGTLNHLGKSDVATSQTYNGTTLTTGGNNTLGFAKGGSGTIAVNLGALTIDPGSVTTIAPGTLWGGAFNATTPTDEVVTITHINGAAVGPLVSGSGSTTGKINVNAGLVYRQAATAGGARWVAMDGSGQFVPLPAGIVALNAAGDNVTDITQGYQLSSTNVAFTSANVSFYGLYVNSNANGRTLTLANDGTLTLNGILSLQSSNGSSINAGTGASNLIIGAEKNLVINMDNGGGTSGGHLTINAPIANNNSTGGTGGTASSVTIASTMPTGTPGNVTLAGNNTFSGGLISAGRGTLRLTHSNAAGTGTITLASTQTGTSTTFSITGGINVANPIQINVEQGRNTIASTGTGAAGDNTLSGDITINGNSGNIVIFNNAGAAATTFTVGGASANSTTITAAAFGSQISFRASTSGALGILNSRINAPNADFNGNNNGLWTVNSTGNVWRVTSIANTSKFMLGADDALATAARVNLNGTGYVDLNGYNQTVSGLTGANASGSIINNSATTDSVLTLAGLTSDAALSGFIADGSGGRKTSLVMNSSGRIQTLSGANTYTGTTTITSGTLALGAAGSIDNTSGVILGGGTFDVSAKGPGGYSVANLSGNGTTTGSLTVSTQLAIGTSPGTMNFQSLTLGAASTFIYDLTGGGTAADLGTVSDTLDLGGAILDLVQLGTFTINDKFTLFGYQTENLAGTFAGLANGAVLADAGGSWLINYSDSSAGLNGGTGSSFVTITAIPEPRAALLGTIGMLLLLRRRR